MEQVTIVGIDLAKRSFQLHGAGADGSVVFRRKLSRERLLDFLASRYVNQQTNGIQMLLPAVQSLDIVVVLLRYHQENYSTCLSNCEPRH